MKKLFAMGPALVQSRDVYIMVVDGISEVREYVADFPKGHDHDDCSRFVLIAAAFLD